MGRKPTEEELDFETEEFIKTFNGFTKAAKKLMAIMGSINKKRN